MIRDLDEARLLNAVETGKPGLQQARLMTAVVTTTATRRPWPDLALGLSVIFDL